VSLPDTDSFGTAGGVIQDYTAVIDATTDLPALGGNQALLDATSATYCNTRCQVRFTLNGTNAPVLVTHFEVWQGGAGNALVVLARTGVGTGTATWPTTVNDEIGNALPNYAGNPHTLNLQFPLGRCRGATATAAPATLMHMIVNTTSANVVTWAIFNAAGAAADPGSALDFDIWVR
jgi:hypothetical protein